MTDHSVSDGSRFPIGKIVALGRNYRAHAEEMNSEVPKEPVIFLKPSTSVIHGGVVELLGDIGRVDHEVELAVHIGMDGKDIPVQETMDHVFGYSVALDITARDLQATAKRKGLPWSIAKGMDGFCPLSTITPRSMVNDPHKLDISLEVNGEQRQCSTTSLMIFDIPTTIAYISRFMTLERGDIILTGTPEGVSPIVPGDKVIGRIDGVGEVRITVTDKL